MITYPCCVCGKPVDLTDLFTREMIFKQNSRWNSPPADPSFRVIEEEHPIERACHAKCSKKVGIDKSVGDWFQWKSCNVPGCCVPYPSGKKIGESEGHPVFQCSCTKLTGEAAIDCPHCGGEGMFRI